MHLTYAIKLYVCYELIPALAKGNGHLFLGLHEPEMIEIVFIPGALQKYIYISPNNKTLNNLYH